MKKWEHLQSTFDNFKSGTGQGDYLDKKQKLFKTMSIRVIIYEFLKALLRKEPLREIDVWSFFNKGLYGIRFLSVQVIKRQLC